MACENHSFCLFLIQKQMNGTLSKMYPKEMHPTLKFWSYFPSIPAFRIFQGKVMSLPSCWRLQPSRAPWPHILLTEASFRVFLSEHKLALWECSGARWLKAMLIRGNKMPFLLHLWPLILTRSPKSWARAMGTNYRRRGCCGAVEVDAPGLSPASAIYRASTLLDGTGRGFPWSYREDGSIQESHWERGALGHHCRLMHPAQMSVVH